MKSIPKYQSFAQRASYSKVARLPKWLYQKLRFRSIKDSEEVTIDMRLGHKINLRATQPYLKRVLFNRSYHDEGVFYLEPFLKEGAVIIDIGANIGLLTCAYAQRFKRLAPTIYAIEAVQQNFNNLVANIRLNEFKRVHPFRLALGREEGTVKFNLPSKDFTGNAVGSNVLNASDAQSIKAASGHEEIVPLTTLDLWAAEQNLTRCDFIKIDIEGAELAVFQGGINFLRRFRPIIQCEYNQHWVESQGLGIRDFVNFFQALDYHCFVEKGDHFVLFQVEEFNCSLVDLLFLPRMTSAAKCS